MGKQSLTRKVRGAWTGLRKRRALRRYFPKGFFHSVSLGEDSSRESRFFFRGISVEIRREMNPPCGEIQRGLIQNGRQLWMDTPGWDLKMYTVAVWLAWPGWAFEFSVGRHS